MKIDHFFDWNQTTMYRRLGQAHLLAAEGKLLQKSQAISFHQNTENDYNLSSYTIILAEEVLPTFLLLELILTSPFLFPHPAHQPPLWGGGGDNDHDLNDDDNGDDLDDDDDRDDEDTRNDNGWQVVQWAILCPPERNHCQHILHIVHIVHTISLQDHPDSNSYPIMQKKYKRIDSQFFVRVSNWLIWFKVQLSKSHCRPCSGHPSRGKRSYCKNRCSIRVCF